MASHLSHSPTSTDLPLSSHELARARLSSHEPRPCSRWLPTSHFLDIEALAKGFHVRDLAEWVEAQRGARGAACADCVPPQPRLLARDQHAARFAEASAAALNLSFTEVHTHEAWPHGYQHGSDDAVSGSDFWRTFNHKYVSAHEPAAPGLLAFGSPVAFGFDQRHLRVDPALRWVRSHVRCARRFHRAPPPPATSIHCHHPPPPRAPPTTTLASTTSFTGGSPRALRLTCT